ncbi:MAG: hypothetical protein EBZ40_07210, partial [Gammaproteobacteria bacterium]|nr:hypothetical protein [Gammaproteobacteria bacterium]
PQCYNCRFFRVTWEPSMPYACEALGFKSRALPSIEVLRSDGRPCQAFTPKPSPSADGAVRSEV